MSPESENLLKNIRNYIARLTSSAYASGKSLIISSTGVEYTKDDFGDDVLMVELMADTTFTTLEMDNVRDIGTQGISTAYNTSLKKSEDKVIYGHVTKIELSSGGPVRLIKEK